MAFGGIYNAIYRGFKGADFAFLRTVFENYVAEHWPGAIGKRNRRLHETVLQGMAWIPINHARRTLGIGRSRLDGLMRAGRVTADKRLTAGNREFTVVLKADVELIAPCLDDGCTLAQAAARLGLKRQRLSALQPIFCTNAGERREYGCPWSIPLEWVERWETFVHAQQRVDMMDSMFITLAQVLRYWPWTNLQVGKLLNDIISGEVVCEGVHGKSNGIGALAFNGDTLRKWFAERFEPRNGEMTLPNVAVQLGIKQEVVYALARSGLLKTMAIRLGRREERRVRVSALLDFDRRYVFGREVAEQLGRSPRAILDFLNSAGVNPIAGPGVDSCRQLVFERNDVEKLLPQAKLSERNE
jgi:hypothetical protein